MKYILISLFLLPGCSGKKCDPIIDGVIRSIAKQFSAFQECDEAAVVDAFVKAESKVLQCEANVSGINGSSLVCSVVPGLVSGLVGLDLLQLKCKKSADDVGKVLKLVLKCE